MLTCVPETTFKETDNNIPPPKSFGGSNDIYNGVGASSSNEDIAGSSSFPKIMSRQLFMY